MPKDSDMEELIEMLKSEIKQYCDDHGRHEPYTGAFVFDSRESEGFHDGLLTALELVEEFK